MIMTRLESLLDNRIMMTITRTAATPKIVEAVAAFEVVADVAVAADEVDVEEVATMAEVKTALAPVETDMVTMMAPMVMKTVLAVENAADSVDGVAVVVEAAVVAAEEVAILAGVTIMTEKMGLAVVAVGDSDPATGMTKKTMRMVETIR